MTTEKSCGAVVYRKTGKGIEYLAVKSERRGHWGFPKGHVEAGENEQETATREVFEETGLRTDLARGFRARTEYPLSENTSKEVIFFIGTAPGQTVKVLEEEITDYRWLSYADSMELLTFDNSREILTKAKAFIDNN